MRPDEYQSLTPEEWRKKLKNLFWTVLAFWACLIAIVFFISSVYALSFFPPWREEPRIVHWSGYDERIE